MATLGTTRQHHDVFLTSHLDQNILPSSTFSYRYGYFWLQKNKTMMAVMPNFKLEPI